MKKQSLILISMFLLVAIFASSCAPAATPTAAPAAAAPAEATKAPEVAAPTAAAPAVKMVGISMPTKTSTRWISDGESMVKEFEALGYKAELQFADNDIPNQLAQIENMVTKGANILIIASMMAKPSLTFSRRLMTLAFSWLPMTA